MKFQITGWLPRQELDDIAGIKGVESRFDFLTLQMVYRDGQRREIARLDTPVEVDFSEWLDKEAELMRSIAQLDYVI